MSDAVTAPAPESAVLPPPERVKATMSALEHELQKLIVGQDHIVRGTLTALFAGGHVLLEGVPGLGKTVLVKSIGETLNLQFQRIQFTPDLMPSDIVGTTVISDSDSENRFPFQPGPIFSNLVLADEINRATPKTQSALLEAMQERTVSVARTTWPLPEPFFVLATQNPIELDGTYPLPEAQLDRFLFKLVVQMPRNEDLAEIGRRTTGARHPALSRVASAKDVIEVIELARQVPIADHVLDYAVRLIAATHPDRSDVEHVQRYVRYGASPRGLQALIAGSKVRALVDGRFNVAFDDIRATILPALRHRIFLTFDAETSGVTTDTLIGEVVGATEVAGR
jgi:MoxR-like ATPase